MVLNAVDLFLQQIEVLVEPFLHDCLRLHDNFTFLQVPGIQFLCFFLEAAGDGLLFQL